MNEKLKKILVVLKTLAAIATAVWKITKIILNWNGLL